MCCGQWTYGSVAYKVEQVTDGQATSPLKEKGKHDRSLGNLIFNLFLCESTKQLRVEPHPMVCSCIDPLDWLPKDLSWPRPVNSSFSLKRENRDAL